MFFDPDFSKRVSDWIEQCRRGRSICDPIQGLVEQMRAQAAYHRRLKDEAVATVCEEHAKSLEELVEAVLHAEVNYDVAAQVSVLDRGTIKNKKASFDSAAPSPRGTVRLGALPLAATQPDGLRALRAVKLVGSVGGTSVDAAAKMQSAQVASKMRQKHARGGQQ